MNSECINAFSDAVVNVLSQFGLEDIEQGEVRECGKNLEASGVICIVGISVI